jgi:hypothetical protein
LEKRGGDGRGVAPEQRISGHNLLDVLDHLPLNVEVLDNGFDNELAFLELAIMARKAQFSQ